MHLLLTVLGILVVLPVAATAIWIGYSALLVSHRVPLPPALSGDRRELTSKAGPLSYYYSGPAAISEPLLLIHSQQAEHPLFPTYSSRMCFGKEKLQGTMPDLPPEGAPAPHPEPTM